MYFYQTNNIFHCTTHQILAKKSTIRKSHSGDFSGQSETTKDTPETVNCTIPAFCCWKGTLAHYKKHKKLFSIHYTQEWGRKVQYIK